MQGKGAGSVNRVELESQVLCAALRQSCYLKDRLGSFIALRELSHLFPDLLPPPEKQEKSAGTNEANYYQVLGVKPQGAATSIIVAYLHTIRHFLKQPKGLETDSNQDYNQVLNAGFILRKPRLRLSHDLVVTRRWLHEESRPIQPAQPEITPDRMAATTNAGHSIPAAQAKEPAWPAAHPSDAAAMPAAPPLATPPAIPAAPSASTNMPGLPEAPDTVTGAIHSSAPPAIPSAAAQPDLAPASKVKSLHPDQLDAFDESSLHRWQRSIQAPVPLIIELLQAAQIIGPLEIQALLAQMAFAPNVPLERLILNAGYVTQLELASIKLGESLLQRGRITMAQFQVAIYDERTSTCGLRMAESLQVRGWLSVEVRNAIDDWHKKH